MASPGCPRVYEMGVAMNLAGGTHHAFADRGEGFCVFNDVAIAIRRLQHAHRVRRVAVIDLDVHQGNGTHAIFAGDASVFTFSMHGGRNYPFHKVPGDLDVELVYRFIRDTVWVAVRWYRPGGDLTHTHVADQYLSILLEGISRA